MTPRCAVDVRLSGMERSPVGLCSPHREGRQRCTEIGGLVRDMRKSSAVISMFVVK